MSNRTPWTRAETDRLEALLAAGHSRAEIAKQLGRSFNSVRAKIEYLGLKGPGMHWKAKDPAMVVKVRSIIEECIDSRGMPCTQITRHLNAIGYEVSNAWVHKQIKAMGPHMRQWALENARRAIAVNAGIQSQRRKRTADGSWERRASA